MPSKVIMSIRIMPEGLEVDLDKIKDEIIKGLKDVSGGQMSFQKQPIAFGLNAIDLNIVVPEDKGSFVEKKLSSIKGVQTVTVQSVSLF